MLDDKKAGNIMRISGIFTKLEKKLNPKPPRLLRLGLYWWRDYEQ